MKSPKHFASRNALLFAADFPTVDAVDSLTMDVLINTINVRDLLSSPESPSSPLSAPDLRLLISRLDAHSLRIKSTVQSYLISHHSDFSALFSRCSDVVSKSENLAGEVAALLSLVCDQPVEADVGRIVKEIVDQRREAREKREILEFLGVILELDEKLAVVREDVKIGKVVEAAEGLMELKEALGVKGGGDAETAADGEPAVYEILRKQWADSFEEDAMSWLALSPDESLGFILADNGFDVWLANVRGTNYSSAHTSLNPNDPEYWNWSWDELVAYDLPAMFQYVYSHTGHKLHYVGHSLGTLMAFGAFSKHEVLNMVRSAALLSPIAYMGQMPSPIARASADIFMTETLYWLGMKEFAPGGGPVSELLAEICSRIDCSNFENIVTGPNCCMNSSRSYYHQQPTATKNIIHLAQMIRTGSIAMYDYGSEWNNYEHYGQATPPEYNIISIPNDLPLFLSYGGKDLLSDPNDVHTLVDTLSGHDQDKLAVQYREDYAHLDFIFAVNAKQLVYDPLMAFFNLN